MNLNFSDLPLMRNLFQFQKRSHKGCGRTESHYVIVGLQSKSGFLSIVFFVAKSV